MTGCEYIERFEWCNNAFWYLIRRKFLAKLRFIDGKYVEDAMFTSELFCLAQRVAYMDVQSYVYRIRANSTMTSRNYEHMVKMVDDYLYVYRHIMSIRTKYDTLLSEAAARRLESRALTFPFFALVRLIRLPYNSKKISETIEKLRKQGAYPVPCPYAGLKFRATAFIINHPSLLKFANLVYSLLHNES